MIGVDLIFDVPDEIVKANETMRLPDDIMVWACKKTSASNLIKVFCSPNSI
jgi:hypothetical protein